jgi:mycothiol synthase
VAAFPVLPGYTFRHFDPPGDHAAMAALINAGYREDGIDEISTTDEVENNYRHLDHSDPATDMVMAERDGALVGYTRTEWWQVVDGPRVHAVFAVVHPTARDDGVVDVLLDWSERRNIEVARADGASEIALDGWTDQKQSWLCDAYERRGFEVITYAALMTRNDLEDIPETRLPAGVEIRPVVTSHLRPIWEANEEAFQDHWGYAAPTENGFQEFLDFPHRDETLWKIAWHGDRVIGQVKSFINVAENEEFGRRRGYTEFISTARDWRKQGIATALICESLRELKRRGMTEAALGVHTENPNGALRLYESLGFEVASMHNAYRKTVRLNDTA